MLCFEAICLGAINSSSKNFTCVKEFVRAYPELTNKITNVLNILLMAQYYGYVLMMKQF